jgi:phosphatidylserine/phosphatidylglycerophosphate/cardiolipin synthase-like enzyme
MQVFAAQMPCLSQKPHTNQQLHNLRSWGGIELKDFGDSLKLIVQPGEGTAPLIQAIKSAKKSVEIVIFRLDQADLERALEDAAERGIFVHALIAFTNRGGERGLRKLEMRFLAKGITVARTADDLVRYHGKMMLIDRKELYVLSYNFTHLDIERSRSFGLITKNADLVREAGHLFDSDTKRTGFKSRSKKFIVSPVNARPQLSAFLKGAKKELLIYDTKISDGPMIGILEERIRAGVKVRILGGSAASRKIPVRKLARLRLHTRAIVRDGKSLFLGSQSLRKLELDGRREIGVIVHGGKVVSAFMAVFEDDWKASEKNQEASKVSARVNGHIKRAAKIAAKSMPVKPVIEQVAEVIRSQTDAKVPMKAVKKHVEGAVKVALKKAVKKAAAELVEKAS